MTNEPPPLYFGDEPTPESDLQALEREGWPNQHPYWMRACRKMAAGRLASLIRPQSLPVRMTEHYDWHRLKVNVTHKVSPELIKWR